MRVYHLLYVCTHKYKLLSVYYNPLGLGSIPAASVTVPTFIEIGSLLLLFR
jgi:hypothetical protein